MPLSDFQLEMETCCRCSACKFIPFEKVTGYDHVNVCPSITRYNFHAYSGGGRLGIGVALLEKEIDFSDKLLEILYNCQMCGACDVSCKYAMDMEVLAPIHAIRKECVDTGHTLAVFDSIISEFEKQGSMIPGAVSQRGDWAEGFALKDYTREPVEVIFHVGCRTAFDKDRWQSARAIVNLLQKAGIDVGIAGNEEACCGGRADQLGYEGPARVRAERNMARIRQSGAHTLITGCAECYHAFGVLYDQFGLKGNLKVFHASQYLSGLIAEGRISPKHDIDLRVTYHDPCYLGRLGEPYIQWEGRQRPGHIRLFDPPKEFRRGSYGVYDPPRSVINSIRGIRLKEMARIKEYAWCCGAGGGVRQYNPEFALWTAAQRIHEAEETGAEVIVTACPGCAHVLSEAIRNEGGTLKTIDLAELLEQAVE